METKRIGSGAHARAVERGIEKVFSSGRRRRFYDPSVHWCGIFQTYLLQKAGVACHWAREIVDDSGGKDLEIVSGEDAKKNLAIGDIVRVSHAQHHFMILEPLEKGYLRSIEGNAGGIKYPMLAANWMGNAKNNVVEQIQWRYRVIS